MEEENLLKFLQELFKSKRIKICSREYQGLNDYGHMIQIKLDRKEFAKYLFKRGENNTCGLYPNQNEKNTKEMYDFLSRLKLLNEKLEYAMLTNDKESQYTISGEIYVCANSLMRYQERISDSK